MSRTAGAKNTPKSKRITHNVPNDTGLYEQGRNTETAGLCEVDRALVLFSSEDQAAGARCSHHEPSRLRPLWGKAL